MKEVLDVYAREVRRTGDMLYLEFEPVNQEVRHLAFHAKEIAISGTVALTIAAYKPTARKEILNAIEEHLPEAYI